VFVDTAKLHTTARSIFPGFALAILIAAAAELVTRQFGGPVMLLALLMGIALNLFGREEVTAPGIAFSGKTVLKIGVACLGARIGVSELAAIGVVPLVSVAMAVAATIAAGVLMARWLGLGAGRGFLTGGATSICGASAALAISAAMPDRPGKERDTVFTIVAVTAASTIAMVLYPLLAGALGLDDTAAGYLIGATIHDVAQVVGAGFTISEEAGETATLTKLFRVALLIPVVLAASMIFASSDRSWRSGLVPPPMLIGFVALAGLNSLGLLPAAIAEALATLSRILLVIAVAAIGLRTDLSEVRKVGPRSILLVIGETLFLLILVVALVPFIF
jgi:uncharacterized integral membrane protein (TIGR00698 family)